MRRAPNTNDQLAALFVVLGSVMVFGPAVWLLERWGGALSRDPATAWGAKWLGERLTAHPYLTFGVLLLGVLLAGGLVMFLVVLAAKRLALRFTDRERR
jgi:hypothetical protein